MNYPPVEVELKGGARDTVLKISDTTPKSKTLPDNTANNFLEIDGTQEAQVLIVCDVEFYYTWANDSDTGKANLDDADERAVYPANSTLVLGLAGEDSLKIYLKATGAVAGNSYYHFHKNGG